MHIDTKAVLDAAGTKWNFLPFKPGLVGGHCIGVDPYYLTFKAESIGYHPKIILAGRKINDSMGAYAVSRLIAEMRKKRIKINKSKILIMGLTFKENCADTRNSGIKKVISKLRKFGCSLDLYDPWVDYREVEKEYSMTPKSKLIKKTYDVALIAVAHDKLKALGIKYISNLCKKNHILYDLKNLFPKTQNSLSL